jgi:hypothetical protein
MSLPPIHSGNLVAASRLRTRPEQRETELDEFGHTSIINDDTEIHVGTIAPQARRQAREQRSRWQRLKNWCFDPGIILLSGVCCIMLLAYWSWYLYCATHKPPKET